MAGPHSARSARPRRTPSCTARFVRSGALFPTSATPSRPRSRLYCGVANHCDASSPANRGARTPTDADPHPPASPPSRYRLHSDPETIGGVSTRMLGFFRGVVTIATLPYGRLRAKSRTTVVATDLRSPRHNLPIRCRERRVATELCTAQRRPGSLTLSLTARGTDRSLHQRRSIMPHLPSTRSRARAIRYLSVAASSRFCHPRAGGILAKLTV